MKVLVAEPVAEEGRRLLAESGRVEVLYHPDLSREELLDQVGQVEALVVRSGVRVDRSVIERGRRLVAIARAGVGVDNIDVEAATKRGIVVLNSPEGNTLAAAEHTVALLAGLARNLPQAHISLVLRGEWDRKRFMGTQLTGKVLGIIGLGRVGSEVARRARGLGMEVVAYDPYATEEMVLRAGARRVELEELLQSADFISLHVPLTRSTYHLLDSSAFARMKRGVRIVNTARGGVVDEAALLAALESGQVAGAALDVFEREPPGDHPLLRHPNVIATPHLGASTQEAQVNVAVDIARELLRVLAGEPSPNAVNAPTAPPERFAAARPFIEVAERLGRLFTEVTGGGFSRLELVYSGGAVGEHTGLLTAAALKGLLAPILHEGVNWVNAPVLARERGLEVVEVREERGGDWESLITLRAATSRGVRSVAGNPDPAGRPRLVEIDGYRVNLVPGRYLLVSFHIDRPGIVGRAGSILGAHDINIASMQVGREQRRGRAVMVMDVDEPIPEPVLEQLRQIPDLRETHVVPWNGEAVQERAGQGAA